MLKIFLKVVQFIIGFLLGILIFSSVSLAGAYLVYTRLANVPPKPVYPDDKTAPPAVVIKKQDPSPPNASAPQTPQVATTPSPSPQPTDKPADKPIVAASDPAPAGSSKARVLRGLNLRAEASAQSKRLGGLYTNDQVLILGTSDDQKWQKIRVVNTGQEGWIKSGNVENIQ